MLGILCAFISFDFEPGTCVALTILTVFITSSLYFDDADLSKRCLSSTSPLLFLNFLLLTWFCLALSLGGFPSATNHRFTFQFLETKGEY